MVTIFGACLLLALAFVFYRVTSKYEKRVTDEKLAREKINKKLDDFWKKVCRFTPDNRPIFIYNKRDCDVLAITTYDRFCGNNSERVELKTDDGEKCLTKRTCTIKQVAGHKDPFDVLMEKIFGVSRENLVDHMSYNTFGTPIDTNKYIPSYTWEEAKARMFRISNDLYVFRFGINTAANTTRAEIERLNTLCYEPIEMWEILKADIEKSIKSRIQFV